MSSGGATLQGSFSGETGTITETGFFYGTTSGDLTEKATGNSLTSPFSAALTGLDPGTMYYYKAYVVEGGKTRSGGEQHFTTVAVATATVSTKNASSILQNSAVLNGSFTGATGSVDYAGFLWGTSSDNVNTELECDVDASFSTTLNGLTENTTYYYKAYVAEYNEAISTYEYRYGSVVSFKTLAAGAAANRGYLDCYEVPAVQVISNMTGTETHGDTQYQAYTTANDNQRVVTHTFSYNGVKRNFSLLYDKELKAALWVSFAMNTGSYPWLVARSDSWKYDPAVPQDWQPNLSKAYNGNYSRGHQVASNDRRTTTNQTKQTNYFTNMTPQNQSFNGGVWGQLEGDIQTIGQKTSGSDTLYVVTGPVFGSGYGTTTDQNSVQCPVPTHYYKCIMKVSFSGDTPVSAVGAAYLLEHKSSGATRQEVTIDSIEELTGFDFFANVPAALQDAAESETHSTSYFTN